MGFRLSFGAGPLRYSTPLGGKRRKNEPGCLASLGMLIQIAAYLSWWALLASAWLIWVPAAGVTAAVKKDPQWFRDRWYHPLDYWQFKR